MMDGYMSNWYLIIIPASLFAVMVPNYSAHNRNSSQTKYVAFTVGAILALSAGLRYCVGTDYSNYLHLASKFLVNWKQYLLKFDEPAVPVLYRLVYSIYPDYASMFFIVSVITVGLYVRTIYKESNFFGFAIILYILSGEWQHSFNGIKQYLAAAVLFAGFRYICDRKFKKYFLTVLIASACHISAIVMLPLYFVATRKVTFKTIVLTAAGVYIVLNAYSFIFDVIGNVDSSFSVNEYVTEGVTWQRVLVAIVPVALAAIVPKCVFEEDDNEFLLFMCIINAAIMVACIYSRYLTRFSYYTQIYTCMAIPEFIGGMSESNRKVMVFITILFYYFFWRFETQTGFYWIFSR